MRCIRGTRPWQFTLSLPCQCQTEYSNTSDACQNPKIPNSKTVSVDQAPHHGLQKGFRSAQFECHFRRTRHEGYRKYGFRRGRNASRPMVGLFAICPRGNLFIHSPNIVGVWKGNTIGHQVGNARWRKILDSREAAIYRLEAVPCVFNPGFAREGMNWLNHRSNLKDSDACSDGFNLCLRKKKCSNFVAE